MPLKAKAKDKHSRDEPPPTANCGAAIAGAVVEVKPRKTIGE